ncbi:DoxX family protein [Gordonia sp. TBRC 11910]|uniref:DoxX family protein n=1 Tax=Gordonia asplenii TaxID=2725283 RepID=A0A848KVD5_9ACTN|nr:DoxX family protein [Gordonia asplenii]NMO02834.1 DoxX family protein [Gordonia asplenii]
MPSLLAVTARALTGIPYIMLGAEAAQTPGKRVDVAAPTLDKIRGVVPLPVDNETVVRANGAVQAVGGALIATGVAPRIGAGVVLGSLIPTTAAGHAFWGVTDPVARKQQQVQFLKNVLMAGGLVAVVAAR